MARKLPGEYKREAQLDEATQQWTVTIKGGVVGKGTAQFQDAAERMAERGYEQQRRAMVQEGEILGRDALIEKVADVLFIYHHARVAGNHGYNTPTPPLPADGSPARNHFRQEADRLLTEAQLMRGPAQDVDPGRLRGEYRRGLIP